MNEPDLIVIGMPRSGTSLLSNILTNMGCDFLCGNESINNMYPKRLNPQGYFQRKDIHSFIIESNAYNFDENMIIKKNIVNNYIKIIKNTKKPIKPYIAYKDPYLLYILPHIINISHKKPIIIIIIRNIDDVIKSCNNFLLYQKCSNKINPIVWVNYYTYFNKNNFDYISINYDELVNDPIKTYNIFYSKIVERLPRLKKIDITKYINNKSNINYKL